MNGDFISEMLNKLSEKTGREWTLADIMRLAEKLSQSDNKNIESLFSELSAMGLNVSDDTKQKVKDKLKDGEPISLEELSGIEPKREKRRPKRSAKKLHSGKKKKK
jgi:hypothetical protein